MRLQVGAVCRVVAVVVFFSVNPASAQDYTFTHLAGPPAPGFEDGPPGIARFYDPEGLALDSAGNIYVSDTSNHTIRKIAPGGQVSTVAGTAGMRGSSDGTRSRARFDQPQGLALDAAGNIYVADSHNSSIRKITPSRVVTTLAGLSGLNGSADGTGSSAHFYNPDGIALDSNNNLYVADTYNHTIRKITPAGLVTTLAGSSGNSGSADGIGSAARFDYPEGVAVDGNGNVYVADFLNRTIRKITPAGVVTTLAGSTQSGTDDGTGSAARFNSPRAITFAPSGDLFVADGSKVRQVTLSGTVTTVVPFGMLPDAYLRALSVDSAGSIYVADDNGTIRRVTSDANVSTLAGSVWTFGLKDGDSGTARFFNPHGLAVDAAGTLYVADEGDSAIRKIAPDGSVTTLAGNGRTGSNDGAGSVASFSDPDGVAIDNSGNVYVADTGANTIRRITPAGIVSTIAGSAYQDGSTDGRGSAARFNSPRGIAVDRSGNLFVADTFNYAIRKITPAGDVTTFAGTSPGSADGFGTAAQFRQPEAIAIDAADNLYVADTLNSTIRKITPAGEVTTIAGNPLQTGSQDGVGPDALFDFPHAIAVNAAGNIYVSDNNLTVRRITPSGQVTTIGGSLFSRSSIDGTGPFARFGEVEGIAAASDGTLYLADWWFDNLRVGRVALADRAQADALNAVVGQPRLLSAIPMTATTWQWSIIRQPEGSTATLSSSTVANPVFVPDLADRFSFRLVASDGSHSSISEITFEASAPAGPRRRAVR